MKRKKFDGRPIDTPQRGTFTYGALAAGASVTGEVTFARPFGAAPEIRVNTTSSRVTIGITTVTPTGFTWGASNWSSGAVPAGTAFTVARWSASL